jgi:hypothetical protein
VRNFPADRDSDDGDGDAQISLESLSHMEILKSITRHKSHANCCRSASTRLPPPHTIITSRRCRCVVEKTKKEVKRVLVCGRQIDPAPMIRHSLMSHSFGHVLPLIHRRMRKIKYKKIHRERRGDSRLNPDASERHHKTTTKNRIRWMDGLKFLLNSCFFFLHINIFVSAAAAAASSPLFFYASTSRQQQ